MGTGLDQTTMDRKIPATLWKTHLLKLVNEAPRAVCVNYKNADNTTCHHHLLHDNNSHNNSGSTSSDTSSHSHQGNDDLLHFNSTTSSSSTNGHHYNHNNDNNSSSGNDHDHDLLEERVEKTESCSSVSSSTYTRNDPLNLNLNMSLIPTTTTSSSILLDDEVDMSSPFGKAFHGYLSHSQTLKLLTKDGHYLIRKRDNDEDFILSFRFNGHLKNFQIAYDDLTDVLFIGDREKGYRSLQELVQEGLTTLYLDQKAGSYIEFMCDLSQFHLNLNGSSSTLTTTGTNGYSNNFYPSNRMKSSSPSPTASTVSKSSMERLRNPDLRLHSFLIHTFEGLSRCQICQNFMWGLSSQGLQCKDCGFSIHESCVDKVLCECVPRMSTVKEIFGTDLSFMVKAAGGTKPPFVLEKCIIEIERKGLLMEGIYRVSGSRELIDKLKLTFEKEREMTDLSEYIDVHSMCGLVKRYLRLLPQPLITADVFERFLNINGPITLETTRRLIKKLPRGHQVTLKYLLQHFCHIIENSEFNRMTGYNLSSVFTPTLICPIEISLNKLKIGTTVLEAMITYFPKLYPPSPPPPISSQQQQHNIIQIGGTILYQDSSTTSE